VSLENLWGLTSILKADKDIIWVGSSNESPPAFSHAILNRIRFVAFNNINDVTVDQEGLVVLSLRNVGVDWDMLQLCLERWNKPIFLVVENEIFQNQWADLAKVLHGQRVSRCLYWPAEKDRLEVELKSALLQAQSKEASKIRGLVRFIQKVSASVSVAELLHVLRKEISEFTFVKESILGITDASDLWRLFFFQGGDVLEKSTNEVWPQGLKIRVNDLKDSQYLANIFGRPYAKLLTIPLMLRREVSGDSLRVPAVFFIYHTI